VKGPREPKEEGDRKGKSRNVRLCFGAPEGGQRTQDEKKDQGAWERPIRSCQVRQMRRCAQG